MLVSGHDIDGCFDFPCAFCRSGDDACTMRRNVIVHALQISGKVGAEGSLSCLPAALIRHAELCRIGNTAGWQCFHAWSISKLQHADFICAACIPSDNVRNSILIMWQLKIIDEKPATEW